ncbi:MAG: DUF2510 domain-containing protein [Ilumatobacter sp.]|uniref:DUF2510 domain-containing protein n=1 Tax=Ilumatobacter sp. TaxID=1967498 RepID=UPI00261F780F|nr:DUF2510 domain-containing protein [Ilumatobacter sp.]MDJ0771102.1 DUF2510 domain-containing protein [Ilumatobacter sp.]
MRVEDAPPAGWYPDPEGGSRLRWWEGTDWSDRYRAPPTPGVVEIRAAYEREHADDFGQSIDGVPLPPRMGGMSRADSEAIINQVRMAARAEAERAAQMFGAQARSATSQLGPLISEYTSKFTRWIRIASVAAVILLVAWLAFQIFAQVSLFEWIGDRIDNITDDEDGLGVASMVLW